MRAVAVFLHVCSGRRFGGRISVQFSSSATPEIWNVYFMIPFKFV